MIQHLGMTLGDVTRSGETLSEHYAVVIPACNEGDVIREVVQRTLTYVTQVIVVDDGSTDDTAQALEGLPILLLRNRVNMGKAASLWRGFQAAMDRGASCLITLDGDGQHCPEDIPKLIAAEKVFPDHLIIGARRRKWSCGPFWRILANRVADFWVSWAAGYPIEDSQSGFRMYPAKVLQHTRVKCGPTHSFVFESEILIEAGRWGCYSIPVPIESPARKASRPSYFNPWIDIARITRMIACRLLSRGLDPVGLYRSLAGRRGRRACERNLYDHTWASPPPENCSHSNVTSISSTSRLP